MRNAGRAVGAAATMGGRGGGGLEQVWSELAPGNGIPLPRARPNLGLPVCRSAGAAAQPTPTRHRPPGVRNAAASRSWGGRSSAAAGF